LDIKLVLDGELEWSEEMSLSSHVEESVVEALELVDARVVEDRSELSEGQLRLAFSNGDDAMVSFGFGCMAQMLKSVGIATPWASCVFM
jgi:hypothetical protein